MANTTILIVEDEEIVAADLASKLSKLGYEISGTSPSGEEAITLARELRPDLVLMDIHLAGSMDGVEAAGRIHQELTIPVIFLTAHSDSATIQRAKLTEPFGYILKPFERQNLATSIEMALYKHQAERKLRESEVRYRQLFDRNPDGVFTLDCSGRILVVNPACEKISGYQQSELLTRTFMDCCASDTVTQAIEHFERCKRELTSLHLETTIIHRDGRRIDLWVTAQPILSARNTITIHCTAKDITVRKQMEEALRESQSALKQANEKLRVSNQTLETRVASRTATLEQRTIQLRALASELIMAEERERRRVATMLHDQLQQVLVGARLHLEYIRSRNKDNLALQQVLVKVEGLIAESINSTRLLTAELSPTALYQFGVGAAMKWLGEWCEEKYGLEVTVETEPEAEVEAEEVKVALFQSVRELLFNVRKHAKVNNAEIRLRRLEGGVIHLEVSDNGVGFDPTEVRSREGTSGGFGLFSLRERLELLGIDLKIESTPGRGSRFTIQVRPGVAFGAGASSTAR